MANGTGTRLLDSWELEIRLAAASRWGKLLRPSRRRGASGMPEVLASSVGVRGPHDVLAEQGRPEATTVVRAHGMKRKLGPPATMRRRLLSRPCGQATCGITRGICRCDGEVAVRPRPDWRGLSTGANGRMDARSQAFPTSPSSLDSTRRQEGESQHSKSIHDAEGGPLGEWGTCRAQTGATQSGKRMKASMACAGNIGKARWSTSQDCPDKASSSSQAA